jgi:tetratricopeptide (TPR) repeat protein
MGSQRRNERPSAVSVANDPRLVHAWRLRAAGRLDEADRAFRELLAVAPLSARAHYGLAAIHWDRSQAEATESHLRQALILAPDDARGLAFLGCVRAASGAMAEARELLGRIDLKRADPGRDCLLIGRLAVALGERGVAAQAYQRYLGVRPNDTRAYSDVIALGTPYSRSVLARVSRRHPDLGLPRAAKAVLATRGQAVALAAALRIDPGSALALWWMGKRALRDGDPAAFGYLERALVQAGDKDGLAPMAAVATTLVEAYAVAGYIPEALATGELAMARVADAALMTAVARVMARAGQGRKAWQLVRAAINAQPMVACAWRFAAELQAERGAWPQAVACARRAIELAPAHPEGWALVSRIGTAAAGAARLWSRLGRPREAGAAWQAVVMVSPGESAGWRGLGDTWDVLGWTTARRRWLERWLPQNRSCGAWLCLARAATERNAAKTALTAAHKVAKNREDWLAVGTAAMELDVAAVAEAAFALVVHADPSARETWFDYGRAMLGNGNPKGSLPWLRGGLAMEGVPDAWLILAEAEVAAGEDDAALRTLWAAADLWPADGQIWGQLATVLRATGRLGRSAWALAKYARHAEGLTAAERREILQPLSGLAGAIRYYDEAWVPTRRGRQVYWRPPRGARG